jgi:hypothetical protein
MHDVVCLLWLCFLRAFCKVITTQGGHNQNDPKKLRFVKLLGGHFGKVYALHWSSDDTEKLVGQVHAPIRTTSTNRKFQLN